MSKHTPGPWSFSYAPSRELFGAEAEAAYASDCEPWAYAEITIRETEFNLTFDDRPNDRRERALADAHLIAAAPEMLEVLKEVLAAPIIYDGGGYDESIDTCGHTGLQPLREKLRYVVAKAEGRK